MVATNTIGGMADPLGRSPPAIGGALDAAGLPTLRSRLFRKYVTLFVLAVGMALAASGALTIWTTYQDHRDSLVRLQREQALAAAGRIGQFITEIETQIGWTTQLPWSDDLLSEQRYDALRLLRLVPAITELARIDPAGRERLRVSRLTASATNRDTDLSKSPQFLEASSHKIYHGPVYFRRETEPYMTIAVAGAAEGTGVSVAEVNLRFMWDVISQIKVGEHGLAYVVDGGGRLIAHPDIDLVLRNTDLAHLPQVRAALSGAPGSETQPVAAAEDLAARQVLAANAPIPSLGWQVFVELPIDEAYRPLYASLRASGILLLGGLLLAVLSSLLLARRMVMPIRTLQQGAARIGAGELDHRIGIATGDELEQLGEQFNAMAGRLQESYATLEGKVAERTRQLELANLAKSRFLAAASHDLRQPLHAMGLFVAQLKTETDQAARQHVVERVEAALSAMNELFAALLDISKLDSGALLPERTAFALDPELRRLESTFAGAAREKGLRLRILDSEDWVTSDRLLLGRILLNLVSNAIRYTDSGGVLVGCRRRGDALRIEVWDTGIGIPEDQRQNIFGEFCQLGGADGARRGGLGLGLAIVDRLCRLLDHPLALSSRLGRGSCFAVTLPAAAAQPALLLPPDPLQAAATPFLGKHVLVIDDDALVLSGMGGLLRSWGCRVALFASAAAAEAGIESDADGVQPDLVISDFHLGGGVTGIALIERLRRRWRAPIPAFLVSGDTSPERLQEAAARGYHLLQKPVPPMTLRALLNRYLHEPAAVGAS